MRVDVVTIFPEYLAPLELSLIGKARTSGLLDVAVHDLRSFATDARRTVDDAPLGGGAGMVMRPEPWAAALAAVREAGRAGLGEGAAPHLLVPTPAGERFTQRLAHDLAGQPWLVFACGRYEGIDERVLDAAAEHCRVTPLSLGDYVLNGGEVAVLAVVEAVARLLPGVLGNPQSVVEESHAPASGGLLEAPVYTRPATWEGRSAPEVLLSGHHARVAAWRREQSLRRTAARRPDLVAALDPAALGAGDAAVLSELGWDVGDGGVARRS